MNMNKRSTIINLAIAAILGGLICISSLPALQGKFMHYGIDIVIVGLLLFFAEPLIMLLFYLVFASRRKSSVPLQEAYKNGYNHNNTSQSS